MADKIDMTGKTGTGSHPVRNLGKFAHPVKTGNALDHRPNTGEKKKVLRETQSPKVRGRNSQDYADFKPKPVPGDNTRMKVKQVANQLQAGGANANLASFQNPSYDTAPFAQQAQPIKKAKVPAAANFYGKHSGF